MQNKQQGILYSLKQAILNCAASGKPISLKQNIPDTTLYRNFQKAKTSLLKEYQECGLEKDAENLKSVKLSLPRKEIYMKELSRVDKIFYEFQVKGYRKFKGPFLTQSEIKTLRNKLSRLGYALRRKYNKYEIEKRDESN